MILETNHNIDNQPPEITEQIKLILSLLNTNKSIFITYLLKYFSDKEDLDSILAIVLIQKEYLEKRKQFPNKSLEEILNEIEVMINKQ